MAASAPAHLDDPPPPAAVVWGLGTGRHLRRLISRGPVLVLAIDLPPGAPLALERRLADYPEVLQAARAGSLRVLTGPPEALAAAFQACAGAELHVHLPALDAAPEPARPLARLVGRVHTEQRDATRHRARMAQNLARNRRALAAAEPLSGLAGCARGRPALVLAAGPSLPAALPHLAPLVDAGPVIAVDTALPVLARAGLAPHVVATVDPHPRSARHLAAGVPLGSLCAFQPYACPAVIDAFTRHAAAAPAGDRLWERIAPRLGLPLLPTSGTVLTFALQIAEIMGCGPVVVAGADLAPVGGLSHAPGTAHATRQVVAPATTHDSRGHAIPTTRALRHFQDAVEEHVSRSPAPHIFVDGGGAAVRGAAMVSPRELSAALPTAPERPFTLPPAPPRDPDAVAERLRAIDHLRAQFDSPAPQTHDGTQ